MVLLPINSSAEISSLFSGQPNIVGSKLATAGAMGLGGLLMSKVCEEDGRDPPDWPLLKYQKEYKQQLPFAK
jgi:hypothetical protein